MIKYELWKEKPMQESQEEQKPLKELFNELDTLMTKIEQDIKTIEDENKRNN
jgi:hypothetical protein